MREWHGESVFPQRPPLDPEDVVDREGFIDDLVRRLLEVRSVLIAGPRRTGKTIVVDEALRRLQRDHGALVAEVDLFYCSTARELASKLIMACLANHDGRFARVVSGAERVLRQLVDQTRIVGRLPGLELHWAAHTEQVSEEEMLDRALSLPEAMAAREKRCCVVFLDEFECVEPLGGEVLLRRMRAVFQRQRHTSHVFAGSRPSMLNALFGRQRRPFYRFADPLSVPAVPAEAWHQYAARKLARRGISLRPAAAELITQRTGGHPWGTVRVLTAAFLLADGDGGGTVDLDVAEAAYRSVLRAEADFFELELAELSDIPGARAVLDRIARGERPYGDRGQHAERVRRALAALVQRCILRRTGRGQYSFEEPLLRDHLLNPKG